MPTEEKVVTITIKTDIPDIVKQLVDHLYLISEQWNIVCSEIIVDGDMKFLSKWPL